MRVDNVTLDIDPGDRFRIQTDPDLRLVHLALRPARGGEGIHLWMTTDTAHELYADLADVFTLRAVK